MILLFMLMWTNDCIEVQQIEIVCLSTSKKALPGMRRSINSDAGSLPASEVHEW